MMRPTHPLDPASLTPFVQVQTARSGGSGGQHVNKVETKVTLLFDLEAAPMFTADERVRIHKQLSHRFREDGLLQVMCQETRSQSQNKVIALQRLAAMLSAARTPVKPRKTTKPSRAAVERRLETKRRQALRKINRRKDWL